MSTWDKSDLRSFVACGTVFIGLPGSALPGIEVTVTKVDTSSVWAAVAGGRSARYVASAFVGPCRVFERVADRAVARG